MIDANIYMTVAPEKRKEMLQTIEAIMGKIRGEMGCISCKCYLEVEETDNLLFINKWTDSVAFENYIRSVHFCVLLGAMELLKQEPRIEFNTIESTAGSEAITAARAGTHGAPRP